jgi:hypothetical protein
MHTRIMLECILNCDSDTTLLIRFPHLGFSICSTSCALLYHYASATIDVWKFRKFKQEALSDILGAKRTKVAANPMDTHTGKS